MIKALADDSRLKILNSLNSQESYAEELADKLNLSQSTVSFHLKKLDEAGFLDKSKQQYYTIYRLKENLLQMTLADLINTEIPDRDNQDIRIRKYREKIFRTFFSEGRLDKLPAQLKKKLVILDFFAAQFRRGKEYEEKQVDDRIKEFHDDYCTIRRYMIDTGIMTRKNGKYRLADNYIAADYIPDKTTLMKLTKKPIIPRENISVKLPENEAGIFAIRNTHNEKQFIGGSVNLRAAFNRYFSELKFGSFHIKALQNDWNRLGSHSFNFLVLQSVDMEDIPQKERRKFIAEQTKTFIAGMETEHDKIYNFEENEI